MCLIPENATTSKFSGFSFQFSQRSSYLDVSFTSKNQQDDSRRNSEYLPVFDLSNIAAATNDFSSDNKLGEGGFGSVYKVICPPCLNRDTFLLFS